MKILHAYICLPPPLELLSRVEALRVYNANPSQPYITLRGGTGGNTAMSPVSNRGLHFGPSLKHRAEVCVEVCVGMQQMDEFKHVESALVR